MFNKFKLGDIARAIKHNIIVFVAIVAASIVLWIFVFMNITDYKDYEMMNFAVGTFGYSSQNFDEELSQVLANDGILQVNVVNFDCTDTDNYVGWLSTYGYFEADVFIINTNSATGSMDGVMKPLTSADQAYLQSGLEFQLQYVSNSNGQDVGLIIHKNATPTDGDANNVAKDYNLHFQGFEQWLQFGKNGSELDFAIYINITSAHADNGVALQSIKFLLDYFGSNNYGEAK